MSSNQKYSGITTKNDALRKHREIKSLKIRLLKEPNKAASIETHFCMGQLTPLQKLLPFLYPFPYPLPISIST